MVTTNNILKAIQNLSVSRFSSNSVTKLNLIALIKSKPQKINVKNKLKAKLSENIKLPDLRNKPELQTVQNCPINSAIEHVWSVHHKSRDVT